MHDRILQQLLFQRCHSERVENKDHPPRMINEYLGRFCREKSHIQDYVNSFPLYYNDSSCPSLDRCKTSLSRDITRDNTLYLDSPQDKSPFEKSTSSRSTYAILNRSLLRWIEYPYVRSAERSEHKAVRYTG